MRKTAKKVEAVVDGKLTNEGLGRIYRRVGGIMERIEGGFLQYDWVLNQLQNIAEGKGIATPIRSNSYLRQIDSFILVACDDTRPICERSDIFTAGIDSDFRNREGYPGCENPGKSTPEAGIEVWETAQDGTFQTIIGGFGEKNDSLFFEGQNQTVKIAEKHRDKLGPNGNFFPFREKVNGEWKYFVAGVCANSVGSLGVGVRRLSNDRVWDAEYRDRFFFPQQVSLTI